LCSFEISSTRKTWTYQSEWGVPRTVKGLENRKYEQKKRRQRETLLLSTTT